MDQIKLFLETMNKRNAERKGFYYEVTDEQIKAHQSLSVEQIFNWLESTNKFLNMFMSEDEKKKNE